MRSLPSVSVVISTRNRGATVVGCVEALLHGTDPDLEIVVVDQSDDDSTERAIRAAFDDPRLTHHRVSSRGLAAGRNDGARLSRAPVIAMTDDDCVPRPDWIGRVRQGFDDPRVALLFGSVQAAAHDTSLGFIPACQIESPGRGVRLADKIRIDGMGACMAFRREAWRNLGGFDEAIGAGTRFRAGEETDFCLRLLIGGHMVVTEPSVVVIHEGFRAASAARNVVVGYWYGTGAVFAKLLKCGHIGVLGLLARLGWRFAFGDSPVALSFKGAATRRSRLWAFAAGAVEAARLPVDRARMIYLAFSSHPDENARK